MLKHKYKTEMEINKAASVAHRADKINQPTQSCREQPAKISINQSKMYQVLG